MRVEATEQNVGDLFDGVMIPVEDIAGKYQVPGWRCKRCGWTVGAKWLPPSHECEEGSDAE